MYTLSKWDRWPMWQWHTSEFDHGCVEQVGWAHQTCCIGSCAIVVELLMAIYSPHSHCRGWSGLPVLPNDGVHVDKWLPPTTKLWQDMSDCMSRQNFRHEKECCDRDSVLHIFWCHGNLQNMDVSFMHYRTPMQCTKHSLGVWIVFT